MSALVSATATCFGSFLGLALVASFAGPLESRVLLVGSAALLLALAALVLMTVETEAGE